jgi:hypothetical protein
MFEFFGNAGRYSIVGLGLLVASCQTSGGNIFGEAAPTAENSANPEQVATANPRVNPNANTRLKNTRSALSEYCPAVRLRSGTETYRVFPKGADKTDADQVRYQATITKVARECAYVGQNLTIKVGARGRVITGPSGESGNITMPIRVAVTQGGETVYSKLYRPVETIASGSTNTQFSFVDNDVVIPAPTATNVRVFIGFDEGPYNTP